MILGPVDALQGCSRDPVVVALERPFPLISGSNAKGRSPLRIVYAFDPARQAVLLIGGDKAGDPKFYRRIVIAAERIWREYLSS